MQSNTFYKYEQDFLNVNPCLTCNFVQPTPLSFLHQLSPVMPTFSVDEIAWQNTSLCSMPALNEFFFFLNRFEQMLGPKENVTFCNGGAVWSSICCSLSQFVEIALRELFLFVYSSGHEIIIPWTSLLCPHSEIVCISKQRTCYLIRCLDRWFFTFICLYDYQVQMVKRGQNRAGLLSLYVSFTVYHELALEDS